MRIVLLSAALLLAACSREPSDAPGAVLAPAASVQELQKTDLVSGSGEGLTQGQVAVVHYTGWLYDPAATGQKGKQFDSSRMRGQPFSFRLGAGAVIRGWEEGLQGMQVGGQRRLLIPAHLAYGDQGAGGVIPPQAPLLFEIELLAIQASE